MNFMNRKLDFFLVIRRPVILEIPHFASLRNREREIIILRSDNGEKWTEHTSPTTNEGVREILGDIVESEGKLIIYRLFQWICIYLFSLMKNKK